jgi:hypothetical protein
MNASHEVGNTIYKLWRQINRPSEWPSSQKRVSTAPRFLVLRVRIPPVAYISVSCKCCVLSGKGLRTDPSSRVVLPTVVCRVWS